MKKYLLLSIPFLLGAILSVWQESVTCNIALNNRAIDLGNTAGFTGEPGTSHITATKQPYHPIHQTIK